MGLAKPQESSNEQVTVTRRGLESDTNSDGNKKEGQATKSARGMPWHWEPMKDVVNCDKLRGAVSKHYIRRFPNGATCLFEEQSTYGE